MGKKLVIKGADFIINAISDADITVLPYLINPINDQIGVGAFINTGIKGNLNTKIEVKFNGGSTELATASGVIGDITNQSKALSIGANAYPVKIESYYPIDRFGDISHRVRANSLNEDCVVIFDKDGIDVNGKYTEFGTTTEFETEGNLLLFKTTDSLLLVRKVYYCKIWKNDVLIRDFVPALKDNKFGMYDRIHSLMYYSASDTQFIYE